MSRTRFLVPLLAETNHEGVQLDRFIQGTDSQLDVLFVVSNTTTMEHLPAAAARRHARLARSTPSSEGVDVRVGVTSTGLGAARRPGRAATSAAVRAGASCR